MKLIEPTIRELASYHEALNRGFSPSNVEPETVRVDQLWAIDSDPDAFLASMTDIEAKGAPIRHPDGSESPRLPGLTRWMWDGDFCGAINLRWKPGTDALPSYVPGHIGFAVPEWKRRKGYATQALRLILDEARQRRLQHVELTAEPDNAASRQTIEKLGGVVVGQFDSGDPGHACHAALLYRIKLG